MHPTKESAAACSPIHQASCSGRAVQKFSKEQAGLIAFSVILPHSFFLFCAAEDMYFIFSTAKKVKPYLCALIFVTVNNQELEANKKSFGIKYEAIFHNYHNTED